ncbi:hypothetical protein [Halogranum gelatinilyticum]|uniref:hypothetical protein n=1 Tax=Halogranum gelatinilyticum TaxID=660521 RepID=UPI001113A9FF|nr:hypothetical protein [Halogranum gelatinilyticum]
MVKVRWNTETGALCSVDAADGPGSYTDDVDPSSIHESLESVPITSEEVIAGALIDRYDGKLSQMDCRVTVDTYFSDTDDPKIATTIAFIQVADEESKHSLLECESCDYEPTGEQNWDFGVRKDGQWTYHDFSCPQCGSIVHIELVEAPPSPQPTIGTP